MSSKLHETPRRRARSWLSIALLTTLLAGCQTAASDRTACPPLITYTAAEQKQAAAELAMLPPASMVGRLVADYGKTRDACRAVVR